DPVNSVHIARVSGGKVGPVVALVAERNAQWDLIDGRGDTLWFVSGQDAPLKKIVRVDLAGAKPRFTTIVAQGSDNLESAAIVGDRI
ncbi:hypothetical protein ACKI1Z_42305, partial [Streptomyces galilaeus]|uniref:hypothetical protein n=1 Tax=Streptomyces galilaeus TaxID=33899 RepID=UPI0038F760F0